MQAMYETKKSRVTEYENHWGNVHFLWPKLWGNESVSLDIRPISESHSQKRQVQPPGKKISTGPKVPTSLRIGETWDRGDGVRQGRDSWPSNWGIIDLSFLARRMEQLVGNNLFLTHTRRNKWRNTSCVAHIPHDLLGTLQLISSNVLPPLCTATSIFNVPCPLPSMEDM